MAPRRSRGHPIGVVDPNIVANSLKFFVSSIRDPQNPKHCGQCLLGAFFDFTMTERLLCIEGTPRKPPTVTLGNVDFWKKTHAFLFTPRTDDELDSFLGRLSRCSCPLTESGMRRYHDQGGFNMREAMHRTYMDVIEESEAPENVKERRFTADRCSFIIDLFVVLNAMITHSGITSVAKGSSTTWPMTPMDLMPFGADSLVESLLQWYRFVPDPIVFQVASGILRVTRFMLIPSLVKYKFSHVVTDAARKLVDRIRAALNSDSLEVKERAAEIFHFHIVNLLLFLTRTSGEGLPHDCKAEIIRGCETKVMQVCCILLYLGTDPRMAAYQSQEDIEWPLGREVQHLYRFFHMHMYPRPDIPLHPSAIELDDTYFPPPESVRTANNAAMVYIATARETTRCSAYKCTNSLQSAGRNFQRCARCNVVAYCGRECQMKAWREEKYPHKKVCPIMRTLIEKGGGPDFFFKKSSESPAFLPEMSRQVILDNWSEAGVFEEDLQLVWDWAKFTQDTYEMPDGTEWTPGYDDYEEIIAELTTEGRGPKAKYMDRLARWPCEVAKEKTLLEAQVFWDADIDI